MKGYYENAPVCIGHEMSLVRACKLGADDGKYKVDVRKGQRAVSRTEAR